MRALIAIAVLVLAVVSTCHAADLHTSSDGAPDAPNDAHYHQLVAAVENAAELGVALAKTRGDGKLPFPFDLGVDELKPDQHKCDVCNQITPMVVDILQHSNTTGPIIEMMEAFCDAKFATNAAEKRVCQEVVFFGLEAAHLAIKELRRLQFNLTAILCTDALKYCVIPCCDTDTTPEQMMINFASNGNVLEDARMAVSWVTLKPTPNPVVQWTLGAANSQKGHFSAPATVDTYIPGQWIGMIYKSVMTDLFPGETYSYRVGSNATGFSEWIEFRTLPANVGTKDRPLRLRAIADMGGGESTQTIARLAAEAANFSFDMLWHTGDISYADMYEARWDWYMRAMTPIISHIPYMVGNGNHELPWNFTAYKKRMMWPPTSHGGPDDAMYYTFSIGQFRFVMLDTETWYNTPRMDFPQVAWAERVLAEAKAQNQMILVGFHRPMYCSSHAEDCHKYSAFIRSRLEPALIDAGVSLVHCGHMHNYERSLPVYNVTNIFPSFQNPPYPVHFVNGFPGSYEGVTTFPGSGFANWSAVRSEQLGFLHLTLDQERTNMNSYAYTAIAEYSLDENMDPLDTIILTKVRD